MKHTKRITALFIFIALFVTALSASPRATAGFSYISVNSSSMLEGESYGVKRVSSIAPAVTLEGEIIPIEQFSIFLKASVAPFNPAIKYKGETLPSIAENVVFKNSLTGSFSLGFGWQLPISYWARYDIPIDVTAGALFNLGLFSLTYDTPQKHSDGRSINLGGGFFETVSFYLESVGFTITGIESFSFADFSTWTEKKTNSTGTKGSLFTATSVIFSWNVSLGMTYRFGY